MRGDVGERDPVIFDAGTGLRGLGRELAAEGSHSIHICLTHLHLDHIEGLGFFAPFYDPQWRSVSGAHRPRAH